MDIKVFLRDIKNRIKTENKGSLYLMRIIAGYLFACLFQYMNRGGIFAKEYPKGINIAIFIGTFAIGYLVLTILKFIPVIKKYNTDAFMLFAMTAISCCYLSFAYFLEVGRGIGIFIALAPVLALVIWQTIGRYRLKAGKAISGTSVVLIISGCMVMLLFTVMSTVARYYTLSAPCFDFGIFTQMFENMKDGQGAVTTVERNYLLSHFSVHVSPAYFVLLPFYMIFPHPVTLQLLQGLAIVSAVIPLMLICRKYGFTKFKTALVCVTFTLYPAFIGGCNYDIHENCLLVPFLMWLFYAIEKESIPLTVIFTILTLSVKEDAAVYVAVIGLYLIFSDRSGKMRKTGALVLLLSVIYFAICCAYLESQGLGIMTWRYSEYIYNDNGGLITVIASVILNPVYTLSKLFTGDKAIYVIQMLAPLAFMPVVTKKFHRYILLIPFILINLMPDYSYQYSIYFQYSFGTGAILIWLFTMNLRDIKYEQRKCVTAFSVVAALMMTLSTMSGMLIGIRHMNDPKHTAVISYLENLPVTEESITADTFFVPALYKQKELYAPPAHTLATDKNTPLSDIILLDKSLTHYDENYKFFIDRGYKEAYIDEKVSFRITKLVKAFES
ncbi:MAG: DUF2079 domain-containing protein [Ruminiclostridium sp.]|nr:DUF2079 domain-containing protein [Ruminiclostridium sp.]